MPEFPIRDNYTLLETFDCRNFAAGFEDQEWGELTDADRWNPDHFETGQMSLWNEPPLPEECGSQEEFLRIWREWEARGHLPPQPAKQKKRKGGAR